MIGLMLQLAFIWGRGNGWIGLIGASGRLFLGSARRNIAMLQYLLRFTSDLAWSSCGVGAIGGYVGMSNQIPHYVFDFLVYCVAYTH